MRFEPLLKPPRRFRGPILVALASMLMLPLLGRKEIVTSHEGRVVQTARQMVACGWPWNATPVAVPSVALARDASGLHLAPVAGEPPVLVNPWLVPVLNGQIRLQKPPLPYWCAAILFKVFGVGEAVARFFPALLGAVSVLFVFDLGRKTLGPRGGWFAGLAWISSYFIIDEFRKAMADPYLAFFTLGVVWAWIRLSGRRDNARESASARTALVLFFYVCVGLGALAKGPLILLHGAIAIAAYQFCFRRRLRGPWAIHIIGVAIAALIALPWFIYVKSHVPHAADIWRFESVGELSDNDDNARPSWFYLPTILQLALPWTPVWLTGIWTAVYRFRRARVRSIRRRRALFPVILYAIAVSFFSFVKLKKGAYLLPVMPAQALLVAQGLLFVTAACREKAFRGVGEIITSTQAFIGLAAAVALPILAFQAFEHRAVAALVFGLPLTIAWIPVVVSKQHANWGFAQAGVYAVLSAFLVMGYLAEKDNQRSGKPAGQQLAVLLKDSQAATLPNRIAADVAVYVPLELLKSSNASRLYVVVDDRRNVAKPDPRAFAPWINYGRVTDVTLLPQPENARRGSKRWKTFEVQVDPVEK